MLRPCFDREIHRHMLTTATQKGKWAADAEAITARARYARQWLKARPEREIVLVSHGGASAPGR
jgi:hypothetical protein